MRGSQSWVIMSGKSCWFSKHGFFYSKGNVAHCCMQDTLFQKHDWKDVVDLDRFYGSRSEFVDVRTSLDSGIEHPACRSCWFYERNYGESQRTTVTYDAEPNKGILYADLRLTNHCNLQCKMCFPGDSDQIQSLHMDLVFRGIESPMSNYMPNINQQDITNLVNGVIGLKDLRYVRLAGGEPFVMPEVEALLSKMVDVGKTDLELHIITNCTSSKPRLISLLKRFSKVKLSCSIDGVGETIEYQRYPSRWPSIESNFRVFVDSGFEICISPCIGMLNYLDLHNLLEWARQFDCTVSYDEILEPSFLNFRFIPLAARTDFYDRFSRMDLSHADQRWTRFRDEIMYEHMDPNTDDLAALRQHVRLIWDRSRGPKFLERYPWARVFLGD